MSRWERPKPRTYTYNYEVQSARYQPTLDSLDRKPKDYSAKSIAEESSARLEREKQKLKELEEIPVSDRKPLWQVHPFYLHEDTVRVPPREDSVWPESRPHFHLVSSYDLMVGYLGIRDMADRENEKLKRARAEGHL